MYVLLVGPLAKLTYCVHAGIARIPVWALGMHDQWTRFDRFPDKVRIAM